MMIMAIAGIVALVVAAAGILAWKKRQSSRKKEKLQSFVRSALRTLNEDAEMLEKGDIGWRILAKGESSIGLSHVVPGNNRSEDSGYDALSEEAPQVAEGLQQRDRLVDQISQYARNAANNLESPVRKVVNHDKKKVSSEPEKFGQFKHMLLQNEEVWMMVLQSLLNGGQNADESTQYGKYWRARRDVYENMAGEKGGEGYRKLGALKEKLLDRTQELQKHLKHMQQRMEYK
jgi:hypothetical protein